LGGKAGGAEGDGEKSCVRWTDLIPFQYYLGDRADTHLGGVGVVKIERG